MADVTFNKVLRTEERGKKAFIVKDATQLYGGMLVGTAVADGLLDKWNNVATTKWAGLLEQDVLGATATGVVGRVDTSGKVLKGVPVAGATQAKLLGPVYCTTSNVADLTTTAPTSLAIGILTGFRSASDCDVQLFTPAEFAAYVT